MAVKKKRSGKKASGAPDVRAARRAVGINVTISILAAAALLVVVNLIGNIVSRKKNLRWSAESLGRYGLSKTSKAILDHVDQKVRLTSIYRATSNDMKPEKYLPAIRNLMDEMRHRKGNIVVENVTSDRQQEEVFARLRDRLDKAAPKHRQVVADFQKLIDKQTSQYEQLAAEWRQYPRSGWLTQFGVPKNMETAWASLRAHLQSVSAKYREQLEGTSLPDYPEMVRELRDTLEKLQKDLDGVGQMLTRLAELPEKAGKVKPELTKDAKECLDQINRAITALGKAGSPIPAKPRPVLDQFAAATGAAAKAAENIRHKLNGLGGRGFAQFARSWRTQAGSLPEVYADIELIAQQLAQQAQHFRATMTVEAQKQIITALRKGLPKLDLPQRATDARKALNRLLDELTKLDEATKNLFAQTGKEDYLADLTKDISPLLERSRELPDLPDQEELITRSKRDNIVVIEVADKTAVVTFEEVWPLAPRLEIGGPSMEDEEPRKVFNGDMAISSKILSLAAEPFAEVLLVTFEELPPLHMRRFQSGLAGPIPSDKLYTLRERLEKANLKVTDWNLAKAPPEPEIPEPPPNTEKLPRVLLILPPPEPPPAPPRAGPARQPRWSKDRHELAIKRLIDSGTPAIFLAGWMYPQYWQRQSATYVLGDYLRDEWGLDVKTNWRVIQTKRDAKRPGKFKLQVQTWQYMGISTFTDHPAGEPLKARRFYWLNACPILPVADSKAGATLVNVLVVPKHRSEIWATSKIDALIDRIRRRQPLEPDTEAEDILPEFALAVEATKQVGEAKARIMAVSTGFSFIDGYLRSPVILLLEDRTIATEPPPAGNVDLLINSVYHLVNKGEYIGAGPATIEPIRLIGQRTMTAIKIIFGLVWPAAFFLVGGAVMLIRRR